MPYTVYKMSTRLRYFHIFLFCSLLQVTCTSCSDMRWTWIATHTDCGEIFEQNPIQEWGINMLSSSYALWPLSSLKRKTILSQGELFGLSLLLSYQSYISKALWWIVYYQHWNKVGKLCSSESENTLMGPGSLSGLKSCSNIVDVKEFFRTCE